MLVVDREHGLLSHSAVRSLPASMPPSLFVVNDTRVIPARLFATKETGGKVEFLLVERVGTPGREETWIAMARGLAKLREGATLRVEDGALTITLLRKLDGGNVEIQLIASGSVTEAIERAGQIPLPPYIRREATEDDRARYQTVFADEPGAVAAPTAGLHFSEDLLASLSTAGHQIARVTLHVGPGTFLPLRSDVLSEHTMHRERYRVSAATADAIGRAKSEGRPVVAVGTTVVRTLESMIRDCGAVQEGEGATDIFIYPPYTFRVVDALFTNFHLPRSTLLALVMAFAGEDLVRRAYEEAVRERYRFFSYGDAMLLHGALPR